MALYSKEGTTQGCPLAMLQYAVGVHPLIMRLKDPLKHIQNWYADDSACTGLLLRIRDWFIQLMEIGSSYGYYAEPSKSISVVKDAHHDLAVELFASLKVEVTTASRFLGGCIGSASEVREYVRRKVTQWTQSVTRLAEAAKSYPQSVYTAFTHSLCCEWNYLQRVVRGYDDEYVPLRDAIREVLTPAILGREILEREHDLFVLPVNVGVWLSAIQ